MILFPKSYTVERRSATDQWVKGQLVPGTPVTVPFIGDVQPANSDLVFDIDLIAIPRNGS